jgi:hypothetical protein
MHDDECSRRRERLQARIIVSATIGGVVFVAILGVVLLVMAEG